MLARLEAKLDALTKENAALRTRVNKIETARQAPAAPVRVAALGNTTTDGTPALNAAARDARAASMPVKGMPPVRVGCARFAGAYIGGNVGYGVYGTNYQDKNFIAGTIDTGLPRQANLTDGGWNGGAQAGYNWQSNCTVFGVEADWNWTNVNASDFFTDGDGVGAIDSMNVSSRMRWFGTVRGRTGVVVDNLLIYLTGGLAYANFDRALTVNEDAPAATAVFRSSSTRWGWVAGFGTEWAWANNWSLKSEVLYMRFQEDKQSFNAVTVNGVIFGTPGVSHRIGHQDDAWISRLGLNYRFGGSGS